MAKYSYHRLDGNAKAIRDGLRKAGVTVDPRCPLDWLCGFRGVNYLLEVKTVKGFKRRSESQQRFLDEWKGQKAIVQTVEEAFAVVGVGILRTTEKCTMTVGGHPVTITRRARG